MATRWRQIDPPSRKLPPAAQLALAVLESAIDDLRGGGRGVVVPQLYRLAREWILDEYDRRPYSAREICEVLGLQYDAIRSHVERRFPPMERTVPGPRRTAPHPDGIGRCFGCGVEWRRRSVRGQYHRYCPECVARHAADTKPCVVCGTVIVRGTKYTTHRWKRLATCGGECRHRASWVTREKARAQAEPAGLPACVTCVTM